MSGGYSGLTGRSGDDDGVGGLANCVCLFDDEVVLKWSSGFGGDGDEVMEVMEMRR